MIPTIEQLEGFPAIIAAQAFPTIPDTVPAHVMSLRESFTAEVEAWRAGVLDVPTTATHMMDHISFHWESILRPWFVTTMGALPITADIEAHARLLQFPATLTESNRQAFQWKGRTEFEAWLDCTTWTHHIRQAIPEPTAPHQPPTP